MSLLVGDVTAQLVSGELEYVHMHHPPSLDRRSAPPPASHPHQIYDVPRSSGASRQPTKLGSSTNKDVRRSSENIDRRSVGSETKRSPIDREGTQVTRPAPMHRAPGDDLPYAVAGMAMRLPPVGRRTQDARAQTRRPVDDDYGFLVTGGTQVPEATFI